MTQSLNLQLSIDQTNVVLAGLAELPAKTSYDLINSIKSQAVTQMTPPAAAPVAEAALGEPQLLVEATPAAQG